MDCLVLDSDGNLIDALSIATRAALFNTKFVLLFCFYNLYTVVEFQKLRS